MTNENICPETELRVLLPAQEIPDEAIVAKRTGEERYVLRHNLKLWPDDPLKKEGATTVDVFGFFLVSSRGGITQVKADKMLHWIVTAEDFIETIQRSWEPEKQ